MSMKAYRALSGHFEQFQTSIAVLSDFFSKTISSYFRVGIETGASSDGHQSEESVEALELPEDEIDGKWS